MATQGDLNRRLVDVESLLAHHEDPIRDLSDMIARQWDVIDGMKQRLNRLDSRLTEELHSMNTDGPEKPPPHW